jgi:hypothetical protein
LLIQESKEGDFFKMEKRDLLYQINSAEMLRVEHIRAYRKEISINPALRRNLEFHIRAYETMTAEQILSTADREIEQERIGDLEFLRRVEYFGRKYPQLVLVRV